MGTWATESTSRGTILVSDWKQNWVAGQEVRNPLQGKATCPLDKIARKCGYKPLPNLLDKAKRLSVVYCGPARGFTDDCEGQRLPVSGFEVEVKIIE